jgi:hypothetical protein
MIRFTLFGAAAIVSAMIASPASAQQVIDEPGMFAFYHPNGDLGIGSTRPPADALAMAPTRMIMRHPLNARRARSVKY